LTWYYEEKKTGTVKLGAVPVGGWPWWIWLVPVGVALLVGGLAAYQYQQGQILYAYGQRIGG